MKASSVGSPRPRCPICSSKSMMAYSISEGLWWCHGEHVTEEKEYTTTDAMRATYKALGMEGE